MRFPATCFLLCAVVLAPGQVTDPRVELSAVKFDEAQYTLELDLTNRGAVAITAYHLLVTQRCPAGKVNGTDELIKLLPVLHPEDVGSWYRGSSDQGLIRPESSRHIVFRVEPRTTSRGECQGADLRTLTVVFADGTGVGSDEVISQIVDHRRGESEQYSRWLAPLRDALAADDPKAALADLNAQLEEERGRVHVGGSGDRADGARNAIRDILSRVRQIVRLFEEERSFAQQVSDKMLRLHEVREGALAKYASP